MLTYNSNDSLYIGVMGRVKGSTVNKSPEVKALEQQLKTLRTQERNRDKIAGARDYLAQYEGEYDRCKTVFFGVNGARRMLKNST